MSFLFEEIAISPKVELCGANEVDIRNQRPRLRRNRLILVEKWGVVNQYQNFNPGVHDHDVLIDLVHIPEGGIMQTSPKLEYIEQTKSRFGISDLDYVGIH